MLQENVVDTKTDLFLRDLAIVIESIKSLLKRDFGRKHPMQTIADSIAKIHTLKDGRKVTDINYANLITKHKKESKQKQEERQQEHLDNSLMLVTALAPHIGYDNAAKIAKTALKNDTTLKFETLKTGLISERDYNKIVDPKKMIYPA